MTSIGCQVLLSLSSVVPGNPGNSLFFWLERNQDEFQHFLTRPRPSHSCLCLRISSFPNPNPLIDGERLPNTSGAEEVQNHSHPGVGAAQPMGHPWSAGQPPGWSRSGPPPYLWGLPPEDRQSGGGASKGTGPNIWKRFPCKESAKKGDLNISSTHTIQESLAWNS